jgi:hypothetical protein
MARERTQVPGEACSEAGGAPLQQGQRLRMHCDLRGKRVDSGCELLGSQVRCPGVAEDLEGLRLMLLLLPQQINRFLESLNAPGAVSPNRHQACGCDHR